MWWKINFLSRNKIVDSAVVRFEDRNEADQTARSMLGTMNALYAATDYELDEVKTLEEIRAA